MTVSFFLKNVHILFKLNVSCLSNYDFIEQMGQENGRIFSYYQELRFIIVRGIGYKKKKDIVSLYTLLIKKQ